MSVELSTQVRVEIPMRAGGVSAFEPIVFEQPLPAEAAAREWAGLGDPGFMALPPGPGLGVELDRAALERYRADR